MGPHLYPRRMSTWKEKREIKETVSSEVEKVSRLMVDLRRLRVLI